MAADETGIPPGPPTGQPAWARFRGVCRAARRWLGPRGWPAVTIAVALGYLVLSLGLPAPGTVSVVQARTESLSFVVANPDLSAIRLGAMRLIDVAAGNGEEPSCVQGILVPSLRAKVDYRLESGGIAVFVAGDGSSAGRIEPPGGAGAALSSEIALVPDPACPGAFARRLPIVGPATLGEELRAETADPDDAARPLIDGTINVYGRALALDLWIYRVEATLYPVSEIKLPGGSRLFEPAPTGNRPGSPWHGFVSPGPCPDKGPCEAFTIDASTTAGTLYLVRPGTSIRPEVIAISSFAQLFSDPSIVFLWILVGVVALLIQTFADASGLFARRRDSDG